MNPALRPGTAVIGTMILRHWNFTDDIVMVPENYQAVDHDAASVDYADIVCVANLLSNMDHEDSMSEFDWATSPSFERVGIDPDMDELELESLLGEVNGVKGVFS